jgi:hypothetical protein
VKEMYWPKVDEKKREEIKQIRSALMLPMYKSGYVPPTKSSLMEL